MVHINSNIYVIIAFVFLGLFTWYYITLPGSHLSPNKNHPKPTVKTALKSYLIYIIPAIILNYHIIKNSFSTIN
jgi:hypothetical protein